MKKYKHKTTGYEAVVENEYNYRVTRVFENSQRTQHILPKEIVEDSSDWELVEEKLYEILEFRTTKKYSETCTRVWTLNHMNKYEEFAGASMFTTNEMLGINDKSISVATKDLEISKVKRLSDNLVISLGDKLKLEHWENYLKVIEIKFEDNTMKFHLEESNERGTFSSWYSQLELVKEPEVLFVSKDGVNIYQDSTYYVLSSSNDTIYNKYPVIGIHLSPKLSHLAYFYETNVKAYIDSKNEERLLDSKVLSINDVELMYQHLYSTELHPTKLGYLKELVKSKQ